MRRLSLTGRHLGLMVSTEAEQVSDPADNTEVTTVEVDTLPTNADGTELEAVPAAAIDHGLRSDVAKEDVSTKVPSDNEVELVAEPAPAEPAAEPAVPVEETPAEPAVEAPAETPAEPEVAEEPAAEVPPAEVPAETPVPEEAAVVEPADIPAEAPPAEEPAETPTPEEVAVEPAAEVPAEEPAPEVPAVAEEPTAEVPAEAPPAETPAEPAAVEPEEIPAAVVEPEAEVEVPEAPAAAETPAEEPAATPDVIVQAGAELGANTDTLVEDLETVNAEADQAEADEAEIAETESVAQALEALRDVVGQSLDHNGLDRHGAAILSIATEHLLNSVGFSESRKPTVSLESFAETAGISGRHISTEAAMENIGKQVKKIYAAIRLAIAKSIIWLKERFKAIFGSAALLESRAKALAERAKEVDIRAGKEGFTNPGLAARLCIGKEVPAALYEHADRLKNLAEEIFGDVDAANVANVATAISHLEKDETEEALTAMGAFSKPPSFMSGVSNPDAIGSSLPDKMVLARSKELLGGKAIMQVYATTLFDQGNTFGDCRQFVGVFDTRTVVDTNKAKLPQLSSKEVYELATHVEAMAKEIAKYGAHLKASLDVKERAVKLADKLSTAPADEKGDNPVLAQAILRHAPRLMSQLTEAFSVYSLNTGKALLDLGALCLKA